MMTAPLTWQICDETRPAGRPEMPRQPRGERTDQTPTITRPDLDRDQDVMPKALRSYKVVVLDWSTRVTRLPEHAM
jgi:hypothetical protein